MQGQKALRFHQKILNLSSEDEQSSYGFVTTRGWVIRYIRYIYIYIALFWVLKALYIEGD